MSSCQWCFAEFRLDPANACLWRGTQAIALTPKAFDVLHYLVTHPDRLVTKDTLLDAIWPETAVSEAVVRIAIGEVRRALGDTAQAPRFIATVHRRGYRFVAPVAAHPEEVPGPAAPVTPTAPQPRAAGPSEAPAPLPDGPAASPRPGVLPLPGTLMPPEAERRPLTVLFGDLVDSTRLATRLDPEDFRDVVRAYHQTCTAVIERFDGYVAQYLGDGLLVYFGYPVAHEDDAQRAVWTGLGIVAAMDPLNTRLALSPEDRVAVRLGVHTGVVVVGDVGTGARQEPLAVGETPHIAARLQHLASSNTLVISAATYQLIAGYFTCEALGEPALRGLAQPLRVYRVLQASGVQSRLEVAAARGLTPLVGRAPEVGLLLERWTQVKAGRGQVVVLQGEAGIGKSRLVQVLKDHVAHEAHLCWECRGVSYYQHTALSPITACLQRWLQWQPGAAPAAALAQLERLLTQAQLALPEAVPLFADLVALPLPAECYPPRPLPPEQQRQRTLAVVLALLAALTEQQPVLVIVEDLHWVDPSTLELLALLLDQAPTLRLYTLLTCRPTFQPPWGFRTHLTPIVLNRLTQPHVEDMIEGLLGRHRLPAGVREQIVATTDGIPLFVEEVTKAVVEAGHLREVPPWGEGNGPVPAVAIPATLHEALMARLDRLGRVKGVAQLGATLGRQFSYALLRAVAPLEDALLQRDLATLVAAELLYQHGRPPQAIYTFKHVLVQEAAYASVLQRVRRQTHHHIVEVLEAQFPETVATAPALLAHHTLRGERWDKAVGYCRQVGEQALARSAHREAVAAFEQALGALQHLPESRDTRTQAIDLRLALRNALYPLGELERGLVNLQEAEVLAEALGDPYRLGWVTAYLLAHFVQACDTDRALASGQRALALAADLGEVGLTVMVQGYLGTVYRSLGDYRRAVACYQKNVACLHGALRQERFGLHGLASVLSRSFLVASLAECGAFTQGVAPAEEGVQIAEAVDHPYSRVLAYWAVGFRALHQGDLRQAIPVLARALALAQQAHIQLGAFWVTATLGAAYGLAGRTVEALPLLEQAIEQAVAMRFMLDHALRVVWLGEAYLLAGRLDEAYTQAQRALAFARAHQARGHEAWGLRLLGAIASHREPPERPAAACYQQALALAEALGMRPLQAHCHRGLGTLYAQLGQQEQARTALSTAIEMYRGMEMIFWLPETEAALAQVEEH
jgi:class 3 adenylate cyclase/DNA-binding winged helix-turn-helix (wHTH) protein/tetratricopeptide (TPR) repeat protein